MDDLSWDLIVVGLVALFFGLNRFFDKILPVLKLVITIYVAFGLLVLVIVYLVKRYLTKDESEATEIAEPIVLPKIEEQALTEEELPIIEDNHKPIETPQIAVIPKRKNITIAVDADKCFFRFK